LELPFADGHFDAVWSCEAIHNVAELDTVLAEVCRVLKPGGSVVLGDLFQLREPTAEQPVTHGLQKWGFNLRTSSEWIRGLERNGVSVRESVNIGPDVVQSLDVCTRLFAEEAKSHAEGTLERIICERTALATTDLGHFLNENEIGWGVWSGVKR
jgi:SAM-dependent methyltransferase